MASCQSNEENKCPYFRNGCDTICEISQDINLHSKKCQYKEETCWQCDVIVTRKALISHLTESCIGRLVKCSECNKEMVFKQLEAHEDTCPQKLITCEYCQEELFLKDEETHLEECKSLSLCCGLKDLGCEFEGNKAMLKEHNQKEQTYHNYLISGHFEDLHSTLDKIRNIHPDVKTEIENLTYKCQSMEKVVRVLSEADAEKECQLEMVVRRMEEAVRLVEEEQKNRQALVKEQQEQNKEFEERMDSLETKLNLALQMNSIAKLELQPGGDVWLDSRDLTVVEVAQHLALKLHLDIKDIFLNYLEYDVFQLAGCQNFFTELRDRSFQLCVQHNSTRMNMRKFIISLSPVDEDPISPEQNMNYALLGLIDPATNALLYYQLRCAEPSFHNNSVNFGVFRLSSHKLEKVRCLTTEHNLELVLMFYQR